MTTCPFGNTFVVLDQTMLNIFANADIIPAGRILEHVYLINRFHKSDCPFGNSAALRDNKKASRKVRLKNWLRGQDLNLGSRMRDYEPDSFRISGSPVSR